MSLKQRLQDPCSSKSSNGTEHTSKSDGTENPDASMSESDVIYHRETDSEAPQVILSLVWYKKVLGAAYYDVDTCRLYLMKDHPENAPMFRLMNIVVRQVEPACIIVSSRTDERVIKALENIIHPGSEYETENSSSDATDFHEKAIQQLPSLDFAYEICKFRLCHLNLPSMPKGMNNTEKRLYMMTLIDFTNACMVKAAGALLKFIEKRRIGIQLEDTTLCPVTSVSMFSLENIVEMDNNTFHALQIFHQERHLSIYKCSSKIKEGLNLYGVLNRCKSVIGSHKLRQWFLQPTNDLKLIKERQAAVKFFLEIKNLDVCQSLQSCLKNIKFIPSILPRMRTSQATIKDWQSLYKTIYNAMVIGDICRSLPSDIKIFRQIDETFTSDLFRIASLINKIVDFDESTSQNRFVVKHGVDDQLDQRKRTYNGLPDFMTKVAQQELQQLSNDIQECSVIYLPQLGYLLAIPETEQMKVTKDYTIENLEFMFISKSVAHYKSSNTRELDRLLGDTLCDITDHETEIMHKLQNVILEISQVLLDVMTYCAELDCLMCFAVIAREFHLVQPEMTSDGSIHIIKGRHLLHELVVTSFMPNDTHSSLQDSKVKVITGPNGSGKSVYLKQVGLIVFLAHIGSFVPAEKAKITLVDQIFSRIQAVESVSLNKSSFFIGLCQMSDTLNHATEKSLVLVDEFGNRTEATAGLFLLAAIIDFWMKKQTMCPHVFVSTHFHRLHHCLVKSDLLKFQTMEVLKTEKDLCYLFRIIEGRAEGSFGNYIALQAGIPNHVLDRERQVSKLLATKSQEITPHHPKTTNEIYKRHNEVKELFLQLDVNSANLNEFFNKVIGILHPTTTTTKTSSNA